MLTGEAILQCGCEQGSTECQRKGCVEGDSRWTKGKGKEKVTIGVVTPAIVLTAVLVFDIQCLPAQLLRPLITPCPNWPDLRVGVGVPAFHIPSCSPLFLPCCPWQIGTAPVLCRCFQQRQWKFGCCLQSEQEEAQLAASSGQNLRTWCNLFANSFILEVPGFSFLSP